MEGSRRIQYAEELATLYRAIEAMKQEVIGRYGVAAWELIERGATRLARREVKT